MDIRKLIKEVMESFMGNDTINGDDIVYHLPELPQTRDEVNWNDRVFYTIPDLYNSFAHTQVYDKEFFTGWDRPYMRQGVPVPHKGIGYIAEFERIFGEKPLFKINGKNIEILNPKFHDRRNNAGSDVSLK